MQSTTVRELDRALRRSGYRLTRPRTAVMRVLAEASESLSPEEIHQRGLVHHRGLGLVTVYRTLELLEALGLARRVHTDKRCHAFALARDEQHYAVCRACGQVAEFPCEGLEPLLQSVETYTGYRIEAHLVELIGLCPACRRGRESGPAKAQQPDVAEAEGEP
jgi:Fe2+ or Zn2+ uptake regulation protein